MSDTPPVDEEQHEERAPTAEELIADLERVTAERDEYLALAQSKQAEFENYKNEHGY